MIVHPAFDPQDRVWFTDEGVIAGTLYELKHSLPKGTKIVGYYPDGVPISTLKRGWESGEGRLGLHIIGKKSKEAREREYAFTALQKREQVQQSKPAAPVTAAVKPERSVTVRPASKSQLPRIRVVPKPTWPIDMPHFWTKDDSSFLRSNYSVMSNKELAIHFKVTTNAIIGQAHRLGLKKQ